MLGLSRPVALDEPPAPRASSDQLAQALLKEAHQRRRRRRALLVSAMAVIAIPAIALGAGMGGGGSDSRHTAAHEGQPHGGNGGSASAATPNSKLAVSCSQNIFSGASLEAFPSVDRSPMDVVIGPVRLARLASPLCVNLQ